MQGERGAESEVEQARQRAREEFEEVDQAGQRYRDSRQGSSCMQGKRINKTLCQCPALQKSMNVVWMQSTLTARKEAPTTA